MAEPVVSLVIGAAISTAAPMLTIKSSTVQVRKGSSFKIYLRITAQECIEDIKIMITAPSGFKVTTENTDNVPKELESGSTFTVVYIVNPPSSVATLYSPGTDTREQKIFVFNVAYKSEVNGQLRQFYQSLELPLEFSIGTLFYLISGVIGLILGYIIKTLTSYKDKIQKEIEEGKSLLLVTANLVRKEVVGLFTSIAIGFIVLLVLSQDTIPTKGWYDSLALGVAIAILSDDQLLTKVKAVMPGG